MLKNIFLPSLMILLFGLAGCTDNGGELTNKISQLQMEIDRLKTASPEAATGFIHTVYFYAAEGLTDERKKEFLEKGLTDLAKVTSIQKLYYGPSAETDREVVDNTYMIAWICHFKSSADHELYQKDPIHLKFIEDYKDVWGKVLVYDNVLLN